MKEDQNLQMEASSNSFTIILLGSMACHKANLFDINLGLETPPSLITSPKRLLLWITSPLKSLILTPVPYWAGGRMALVVQHSIQTLQRAIDTDLKRYMATMFGIFQIRIFIAKNTKPNSK